MRTARVAGTAGRTGGSSIGPPSNPQPWTPAGSPGGVAVGSAPALANRTGSTPGTVTTRRPVRPATVPPAANSGTASAIAAASAVAACSIVVGEVPSGSTYRA